MKKNEYNLSKLINLNDYFELNDNRNYEMNLNQCVLRILMSLIQFVRANPLANVSTQGSATVHMSCLERLLITTSRIRSLTSWNRSLTVSTTSTISSRPKRITIWKTTHGDKSFNILRTLEVADKCYLSSL